LPIGFYGKAAAERLRGAGGASLSGGLVLVSAGVAGWFGAAVFGCR
jgi:hypothetical protein